jgi:hypothetical protein
MERHVGPCRVWATLRGSDEQNPPRERLLSPLLDAPPQERLIELLFLHFFSTKQASAAHGSATNLVVPGATLPHAHATRRCDWPRPASHDLTSTSPLVSLNADTVIGPNLFSHFASSSSAVSPHGLATPLSNVDLSCRRPRPRSLGRSPIPKCPGRPVLPHLLPALLPRPPLVALPRRRFRRHSQ